MSFCAFSALFSIPSQVNWIHYELESKLKNYCFGFMETLSFGIKIKELLFWLHRKQSIAIIINIIANCQTILISSHVSITLV